MPIEYQPQQIDETSVTVPAYIIYPDIRLRIPPGSVIQGDTLTITYTLMDSGGNAKFIDNTSVSITFNVYPFDSSKEVLGVIYASFAESPRIT